MSKGFSGKKVDKRLMRKAVNFELASAGSEQEAREIVLEKIDEDPTFYDFLNEEENYEQKRN